MNNSGQPPDNWFNNLIKALSNITDKINQLQRTLLGAGILVVILIIAFLSLNPSKDNFIIVAIGVLALMFLIVIIALSHTPENGGNMSLPECENLLERLAAAQEILNALETKRSQYPKTDIPAILMVDIKSKQAEVEKLKREVEDCKKGE